MFNYFFDVLHQDVLIHLSLILMGLKAQSHHDHLSGIEPKLCVLAKHYRGKLVFKLSAKLLQHDVALGEFSRSHSSANRRGKSLPASRLS